MLGLESDAKERGQVSETVGYSQGKRVPSLTSSLKSLHEGTGLRDCLQTRKDHPRRPKGLLSGGNAVNKAAKIGENESLQEENSPEDDKDKSQGLLTPNYGSEDFCMLWFPERISRDNGATITTSQKKTLIYNILFELKRY